MTHHSLLQISTTRVYWEPLLKEGKGWYNARLSLLRLSDGAWGMGVDTTLKSGEGFFASKS